MVYHGGARESEKHMMDFSFSANPYKPKFLEDAIRDSDFQSYPYCESIEEKIREKYKIKGDVIIGAGITELLYMAGYAFRNRRAIIPAYTYGEYERIADLFSMEKVLVKKLDPDEHDLVKEGDVIFFCNPNNPTGKYKNPEGLFELAEDKDLMIILDESFIDFADKKPMFYNDNVVVLRSFTKPFGVPGIRIGYAFGNEDILEKMSMFRQPWSPGSLGCSFAKYAIENTEFLDWSIVRIRDERNRISNLTSLKTNANFFLVDVEDAKKARKYFFKKNILVRDCSSFGIPNAIRFSVKTKNENDIFLEHLQNIDFRPVEGINYEI